MTITSNIHVGLAAWSNHSFAFGERCSNAGNAYQCITAGLNISTAAPTGTSADVNNGGVAHFKWLSAIDYTTLQAWSDAIPATLTQPVVGLVWNDGVITTTSGVPVLDISGHTTTSTNNITLKTATGESLRDQSAAALAVNTLLGVTVDLPSTGVGGVNYININNANVVVDGIQFRDPNSGSASTIFNTTAVDNLKLIGCIFDGYAQASGATMLSLFGTTFLAVKCLFIDRQPATAIEPMIHGDTAATGGFVNCTFISTTNNTNGPAIRWTNTAANSCIVKNSILMGWSTATVGQSATPIALDHCVLSGTIDTGFSTDAGNNLVSKTAANQFVSATTDFRLKTGADAINAGVVDTIDIPAGDDFFRVARGATWDIGAAEFVPVTAFAGSATIGGSTTLTATPIRVAWASDTINASVFFGGGVRPWTVDFTADFGPVTASGGVNTTIIPGGSRATLLGSASVVVTARMRAALTATLAGSAVVALNATHRTNAAATLSGVGSVIANPGHTVDAAVTIPAGFTAIVSAVVVQTTTLWSGSGVVAGSGSVIVNPTHTAAGNSAIGATGLLVSDSSHTPLISATLLSSSFITVAPTMSFAGSATFVAVGATIANPTHTPTGNSIVGATGLIVSGSSHTPLISATLTGSSSIAAASVMNFAGLATFAATGTVTANPTHTPSAAVTLSGAASVVAGLGHTPNITATIVTSGALAVDASVTLGFAASSSIAVVGDMASTATTIAQIAATLSGSVTTGATATAVEQAIAEIDGGVTMVANTLAGFVNVEVLGSATLDVSLKASMMGVAVLSGSAVLSVATRQLSVGRATIQLSGFVEAYPGNRSPANVVISGTGVVATNASHTPTAVFTVNGGAGLSVAAQHPSFGSITIQLSGSVGVDFGNAVPVSSVVSGTGSVATDASHVPTAGSTVIGTAFTTVAASAAFSADFVGSGKAVVIGGASHTVTVSSVLTGSGSVVADPGHTPSIESLIQGKASVSTDADSTSTTTIIFSGVSRVTVDTSHTANGSARIDLLGSVLADPAHTPLVGEDILLDVRSLVDVRSTAILNGGFITLSGEASVFNSGERPPTVVTTDIDATGEVAIEATLFDTQAECRIQGVSQVISGGIPSQFAEVVIGGSIGISVESRFTFRRRSPSVPADDYSIPWFINSPKC